MVSPDIVRYLRRDLLGPDGAGVLVMLQTYMDTGSKREFGGVYSAAAAVFRPLDYDFFVHEWHEMLRAWGVDAFHATDFYTGAPPFERNTPERMALFEKDSRRIPGLIAGRIHKLFLVTFNKEEYERVAPFSWRRTFGGVERVAAQALTSGIGHWANKTKMSGQIAYFYELGDRHEAAIKDAFDKIFANHAMRQHLRMAATPIGVQKGGAHGLEVADFLAWHWNKFYTTTEGLTRHRRARKDIRALMEILSVREDQIEVAAIMGDNLRRFLISQGCEIVGASRTHPARDASASRGRA